MELQSRWSQEHHRDVNPRLFFSLSKGERGSFNHCWFRESDEWGNLITATSESVWKKKRPKEKEKKKEEPRDTYSSVYQDSCCLATVKASESFYECPQILWRTLNIWTQQTLLPNGEIYSLLHWSRSLTFVSLRHFHTKYNQEVRKKNARSASQPSWLAWHLIWIYNDRTHHYNHYWHLFLFWLISKTIISFNPPFL